MFDPCFDPCHPTPPHIFCTARTYILSPWLQDGFLFEYEDNRPRSTPTESELWRDMLRQLETRETCGVPEDFWNDIKDNRLQYSLAEAEEWSQMLRQMEKKQALDMQEHFSSEVKIWTLKFHHDSWMTLQNSANVDTFKQDSYGRLTPPTPITLPSFRQSLYLSMVKTSSPLDRIDLGLPIHSAPQHWDELLGVTSPLSQLSSSSLISERVLANHADSPTPELFQSPVAPIRTPVNQVVPKTPAVQKPTPAPIAPMWILENPEGQALTPIATSYSHPLKKVSENPGYQTIPQSRSHRPRSSREEEAKHTTLGHMFCRMCENWLEKRAFHGWRGCVYCQQKRKLYASEANLRGDTVTTHVISIKN